MIKCSNPTLLNVTYIRPSKKNDIKECFEVIYKDEQGNVYVTEEPAEADIYIVKPEYRNYTYNKPEERMEVMDKIRVPISKIKWTIAEHMGEEGKKFYKECLANGEANKLDQLFKWPYCYGCDFQPEYYYYKQWYDKYKLNPAKLSKGFLDIEVDQIDYMADMDNVKDTAFAPVNVVTVILDDTKESWTFVLKPYKPPRLGRSEEEYQERYKLYEQQKKVHDELFSDISKFSKELNDIFDDTYGHLTYNFRDYEHEIDLIADVFAFINKRKPNFVMIWNMRFDIPYMYYRIRELGYDPASVMCHKDFKNLRCYYTADRTNFEISKQFDIFNCSSYTQYICQMRTYGLIRKSQHTMKSFKLNTIADGVLRDKKVEYPENSNFIRFPYVDWKRFLIYNIKDVLLQLGIERKCNDLVNYYTRSHFNLTPYNKMFRETHLLRNVREQHFETEGWVQSNNLNIIGKNEDELDKAFYGSSDDESNDKVTFKGAIMADPLWNAPCGLKIMGTYSNNVYSNLVDFDMGAYYPSCKISSNMDPITLISKASFVNEEFRSGQYHNRSLNTQYEEIDKNGNRRPIDFTGEAVNTYVGKNILTFGYNYLNCPSITDLEAECVKQLANKLA